MCNQIFILIRMFVNVFRRRCILGIKGNSFSYFASTSIASTSMVEFFLSSTCSKLPFFIFLFYFVCKVAPFLFKTIFIYLLKFHSDFRCATFNDWLLIDQAFRFYLSFYCSFLNTNCGYNFGAKIFFIDKVANSGLQFELEWLRE